MILGLYEGPLNFSGFSFSADIFLLELSAYLEAKNALFIKKGELP